MRSPLPKFRMCAFIGVSILLLGVGADAQESPKPTSREPETNKPKVPVAKKLQTTAAPAETEDDLDKASATESDKDSPEQVQKRDEWFYKQRSSVNGRIPAGARFKAFQHMQRMMQAEGKLVRQSDGLYAATIPQAGPVVGGTWSSLGPAPTAGGFFSPVSGRIEAIAIDPSDPTGNTVLIGGAQGGIWRTTDGTATWTPTGDSNPSLAMGSIAFAPSACNPTPGSCTVYAGTGEQASIGFDVYSGAGVLKSTDHGQTWTQTCVTPSSTCPFLGPFTNTLNFGFFNDGGARISYIAVNPTNPNLVLVGAQIPRVGGTTSETAGGIYCSSDGGTTWTSLLIGEAGSFVGFASPTVAYAALGRPSGTATGAPNPNGIYRASNANASSCPAIGFQLVTPPTTQSMGRIDVGIAPSDATGNTVYVSIANATTNSATNLGVFVTTNGGVSWTQTAAPDICRQQCWYDNVVKVDPSNKDTVFIGGSSVATSTAFEWVMRSTNGTSGGAFSPAIPTSPGGGDPSLPHVDQHAMAFFKPTSGVFAGKVLLYLGNDGGLWRTQDAEASTVTWTNLNPGLNLTQFYPNLSVNPSNPTIAYGGAQDNGSQVQVGSQGNNWRDNGRCGDGGQTAVDFQVPTSVYITCQFIRVLFSPSGGTDPNSYVPIGGGINPSGTDSVDFIPPIATDPSTPGRVYFGTDHVYQSSDNGSTFTAISGVLPTRSGNYLTAFGVSPNNPAVVYAGANGGDIFVATNVAPGSASFSQVAGQSQHPVRNVTALAVDPHDPTGNTVYAAFSGFAVSGQDTLGHVFVSLNGGAGWADVSCTNFGSCQTPNATDLPNIPVNDLVVDPDLAGTIYAATDIGIFQGICVGTACTWNTLGTGLPNVSVLSLKLHEPSRTLVAGTHGRGAWSLVLTNFSFPAGPHISSLSPFSVQAFATSPLPLTVNGSGLTGATAVQWKAGSGTTALTPTVLSDSQVTATVPVSLLASGGTVQVSVSVGAANSNSLTFVVPSASPTISSVSPTNTPANVNSADIPVIVTGTNFTVSSQVMLNPDYSPTNFQPHGKVLIPTTFKSATQLSATIPGSFMTGYGSLNSVGVRTLPPGGGITLSPPVGPTPLPTFTVVASPPANDNFASAMPFTSLGGQLIVDSSAATTESTDPILPCVTQQAVGNGKNGSYNTVWFTFTPNSSGTIADLSTQFSNYDTTLAVFTKTAGILTLVPNACNDDINPGVVVQSDLQNIAVTSGTTYYIMVGAFGPPNPNPIALGGYSNITLSFTPGPPDFTITSSGTTTQTVPAGQTATFTNVISIAAQNGFSSQVNVSCALPVNATSTTCSVNPASFPTGSGTASVAVTTMARGAVPPSWPRLRFISRPQFLPILLFMILLSVLLIGLARTRRRRFAGAVPLAILILLLTMEAIGCGSSSSSPPPTGTPAGTYTVTVTATSGTLTHTSTLSVTVQ
jgi:hypothetical protein